MFASKAAWLTLLLGSVWTASGHVSIKPNTVAYNMSGDIALRVPHACAEGPTTNVTVQIPVGFTKVSVKYAPGFDITTTNRPVSATTVNPGFSNYTDPPGVQALPTDSAAGGHHHRRATDDTETVDTVSWHGGKIPKNAYYDFHLSLTTPATEGVYYFPIIQVCEDGMEAWVEWSDDANADFEYPVPTLKVTKPASSMESHDTTGSAASIPVYQGLWLGVVGLSMLLAV
ncbi:hypothetical protein IWQ62_006822 [Dispira parvispora]|uniref:YncI copper-binding domain-containing protein n=1 Tax=Dispira parvispora TaxID=1520584 RepID=A0A9W8AMA4_9FUNG|nr:hypothetical protein IWQ62_006822 [Dispira parvispora]